MDEEDKFEKWDAAKVRRTKEYQTENFISEVTPDMHVVGNEGRELNEAQDILARTHHKYNMTLSRISIREVIRYE